MIPPGPFVPGGNQRPTVAVACHRDHSGPLHPPGNRRSGRMWALARRGRGHASIRRMGRVRWGSSSHGELGKLWRAWRRLHRVWRERCCLGGVWWRKLGGQLQLGGSRRGQLGRSGVRLLPRPAEYVLLRGRRSRLHARGPSDSLLLRRRARPVRAVRLSGGRSL